MSQAHWRALMRMVWVGPCTGIDRHVDEIRRLLNGPTDESDAKVGASGGCELSLEPAAVAIASAEESEAASAGDCPHELCARNAGHRRTQHRYAGAEHRLQRVHVVPLGASANSSTHHANHLRRRPPGTALLQYATT